MTVKVKAEGTLFRVVEKSGKIAMSGRNPVDGGGHTDKGAMEVLVSQINARRARKGKA